jgi:hypothetical protein
MDIAFNWLVCKIHSAYIPLDLTKSFLVKFYIEGIKIIMAVMHMNDSLVFICSGMISNNILLQGSFEPFVFWILITREKSVIIICSH